MGIKEVPVEKKRYEMVAPDGGWGYIIWIALIINMVALTSFVTCIGIMYNEIYIQLEMSSTSITLLNGVGSMSTSLAGLLTAPLLNSLSIRKLGFVAAIAYNLGTFGLVFVNSRVFFFLCAILQSLGNGILFNISYSVLNKYFVKKRMLSVTFTQTIAAIFGLFSSQFVKWTTDVYGYRGTLMLITGIYMQLFVGIALMQPVEWHLKKIEITDDKEIEIKPLLIPENGTKEKLSSSMLTAKLSNAEYLSHVDKKGPLEGEVQDPIKTESVFQNMFKDFRDVQFIKSFLLSNASIGLAISAFSDVTFVLMLPQALYFMKWTESEVAWAISLNNFGDLVIKVIFILFNNFLLKFGSSEIYIAGLFVAFFSRLGMLGSDNPTVMLVFITIMGASKSVLMMFISLVISDAVDKDKFTTAMGIFMMLYGIIFLVLGPLVGAVRDLSNSYGTAFYVLTSCYAIVIMFWSIELLYKKNKHKRLSKKEENA